MHNEFAKQGSSESSSDQDAASAIAAALSDLSIALYDLDAEETRLVGKISPILSASEPTGEDSSDVMKSVERSALYEQIRGFTHRVQRMSTYISSVTERVEV